MSYPEVSRPWQAVRLSSNAELEHHPQPTQGAILPTTNIAKRPRRIRNVIIVSVLAVALIGLGIGLGVGLTRRRSQQQQSDFGSDPLLQGTTGNNALVIFGASYCDNAHSRASQYSASLTQKPYYEGRKSNGPVWNEYLAGLIGVGGRARLLNYAYSGATISNSLNGASVPDSATQMKTFVADLDSKAVQLPPSKSLVAIWVGLNTLLDIWHSSNTSSSTAISLSAAESLVDQNLAALSSQLAGLQTSLVARKFKADILLLPLPPMERLPYARITSGGNAGQLTLLKTLSDRYNAGLLNATTTLKNTDGTPILSYDIPSLIRDVMDNPASVAVTDTTNPCLLGDKACRKPGSYFWWDSIHPSTKAHRFIATNLGAAITAYWSPKTL